MQVGFHKNRAPIQVLTLLGGLCLLAGGAAQFIVGSDASTSADDPPLRLAVSEKVVVGVSISDARAAMGVWSEELLKKIDVKMTFAPNQDWVMSSDQLLAAVRGGKVDLFCLTVQEYRQVTAYVDTSRIMTDDYGGDELLLVVREDGGIVNLAGLRGRSLIILDSPTTTLAEPWLAVSLGREGLESPKQVLGHITRSMKLSQAVLPVFFGQADACVVTRRGLDTMAELNPQLSRKLKVLLTSPKMVTAFFACRKDYAPRLKKSIMDGVIDLKSSPTAKQVLVLFQTPAITYRDADCLRPANALLDAYERHREPATRRKK
ncbi:MAG: PhnD/SsuA/transferrin family substrate-binding protein [Terriglobia bacterium]|jgi:phosphonate transport system substrate-binding protein